MKSLAVLFGFAVCLSAAEKLPPAGTPTYAKEVSRIVQKNCEGCHRPGQIGPFSLTNHKEVSAFRAEIKRVVTARIMPPWSAVPGHGEFKNERRLTPEDIDTLSRWADAGAPLGNAKDLPPQIKYNDDWKFGKPDLIYTPEAPFELTSSGADEYRCFVVPSGLADNRYIRAMEVRPGNRKVVHHVRVFADMTGQARKLDDADPKSGFDCSLGMASPYKRIGIGGWAPGLTPELADADTGTFFPKGSDVVIEIHYHKNGLAEKDRSTLGVWLQPGEVKHVQKSIPIANLGIKIPAGAEHHEEKAKFTLSKDIIAMAVLPHMHLLGSEMSMVATFPDGTTKELVWAKPYDFNWQTTYRFKDPIPMPKGTRIDVTAYYNNSASNPKNPNSPLKDIRWGEGTNEEMLVGFLSYIDAQ